jgi:ribosomal protein L32
MNKKKTSTSKRTRRSKEQIEKDRLAEANTAKESSVGEASGNNELPQDQGFEAPNMESIAEAMNKFVDSFGAAMHPLFSKISSAMNDIMNTDVMQVLIKQKFSTFEVMKMVEDYVHSDEVMEELNAKEYARFHNVMMEFQKFVVNKAKEEFEKENDSE